MLETKKKNPGVFVSISLSTWGQAKELQNLGGTHFLVVGFYVIHLPSYLIKELLALVGLAFTWKRSACYVSCKPTTFSEALAQEMSGLLGLSRVHLLSWHK